MRPKWPDGPHAAVRRARRGRGAGRVRAIPGVARARRAAHHAVLLAAHAWEHDPLSRLGSLADIAAMTLEAGARGRREIARELGRRAPVGDDDPRRSTRCCSARRAPAAHADLAPPPARGARAHGLRSPRRTARRPVAAVAVAAPGGGHARARRHAAPATRRALEHEAAPLRPRAAQRVAAPVRSPDGTEDRMTELKLRGEGVAWTDVDGEIVALDEARRRVPGRQRGGRAALAGAGRGRDARSLAAALAREYGIDRRRAPRPTPTPSSPRCASAGCSRADAPRRRTSTTRAPACGRGARCARCGPAARRGGPRRPGSSAAAACAARAARAVRVVLARRGAVLPGARARAAALAARAGRSRATSWSARQRRRATASRPTPGSRASRCRPGAATSR